MGFKSEKTNIKNLFIKNKMIADIIGKQSKQRIPTTTGSIPKGLNRHQPAEGRIKDVEKLGERMFHEMEAAKVQECNFSA